MKKQHTILVLIICLILGYPSIAIAYPGQYSWDPLYIEIKENPIQKQLREDAVKRNENLNKINSLIAKYGSKIYYTCYQNYCATGDMGNPNTQAMCLLSLEYNCLMRESAFQDKSDDSLDEGCHKKYGTNSYYKETINGTHICDCVDGHEWQGDICAEKTVECPANSTYIQGSCVCNDDFIDIGEFCKRCLPGEVAVKNQCIDICEKDYPNSYAELSADFKWECFCDNNFRWDEVKKSCVVNKILSENNIVIKKEKALINNIDDKLSKNLAGKILLQVENNGESWYVNPDDKKKYYLGRPTDAFNVMKNLGLGIKHSELSGYLNFKFPSLLSGKILLDVEQNGEAYYVNPNDLKGYYLNRPVDAFKIMRELGLGITNNDIRRIDVGEI